MIASAGLALLVIALAAALGWRLARPWGLGAAIGALPLLAWCDTLCTGHPPVSPLWLPGLALGDWLARRPGAPRPAGARLWWALGWLALGQAVYLIWLIPYP